MTKRRANHGSFECTLCLQARFLADEGRYDAEVSGQDYGEPACTILGGQVVSKVGSAISRPLG